MNNSNLQLRINDNFRNSCKTLEVARSYTGLSSGSAKKEGKHEAGQNNAAERRSVATTVIQAAKLSKWAAEAKKKAHELEVEYNSIDILMFHPFETLRMKWDMAVMIVMTYILIDIPYAVCFEVNVDLTHPYEIVNLLVDIFLMFDIIFTFNTGFIEDGEFITDRRRIAWHYMTGWFWIDFITSIPLTHIVKLAAVGANSRFFITRLPKILRFTKVFRMVKLLRLFKLYQAMSQWDGMNESSFNIVVRLSKLLMVMFMMSHISACVLMGITLLYRPVNGSSENFEDNEWHPQSWIVRADFAGFGRGRTYLGSLYWAFTTLTTVGYGDITSYLPGEIAWTVLVMICGTSLFGYIIGNVASVMTHVDETAVLIQNKIQSVMAYMRYREFPPEICNKIRRHYEYSWKRSQVYNEEEILLELPTTVRTEVALFIHRETILKVPFLKQLGEDVVPMLVLKLKPILASPRDVITKEDYFGEEMYFVTEGELKMFLGGGKIHAFQKQKRQRSLKELVSGSFMFNRSHFDLHAKEQEGEEITREMEIHVGNIKKGDYFAEYAIILDFAKHPMSVRALNYCDLFSMSKDDFEDISDHFPSVFDQVITVGQKRYLWLMQTLQRKRTWAVAAQARGVQLEKIEGEDIQEVAEPDGTLDKPMGFLERWNRRRSLQQLIEKKNEERNQMEIQEKDPPPTNTPPEVPLPETSDAQRKESRSISIPKVLQFSVKTRQSNRKYSNEGLLTSPSLRSECDEENQSEIKGQSPGSLGKKGTESQLGSALKKKLNEISQKSLRKVHIEDEETSTKKQTSARTFMDSSIHTVSSLHNVKNMIHHGIRDTVHDVKEKIVHGAHEGSSLRRFKSPKTAHKGQRNGSGHSSPSIREYAKQASNISSQSTVGGHLSIHMLAKIKIWKNRAVMNVALNNMKSIEKCHRQKVRRRLRGRQGSTYGGRRDSVGSSLASPARPFGHWDTNPMKEELKVIEARIEKMENMIEDLHSSAEETNDSLACIACLLGQLGKQNKVQVNEHTRQVLHMDSIADSLETSKSEKAFFSSATSGDKFDDSRGMANTGGSNESSSFSITMPHNLSFKTHNSSMETVPVDTDDPFEVDTVNTSTVGDILAP